MATNTLKLPGSIFAERGRLTIKIPVPGKYDASGRQVQHRERTQLPNNKQGRSLASERHYRLYRQFYLGEQAPETGIQIRLLDAFDDFIRSKPYLPKSIVAHRSAITAIFHGTNPYLTDDGINSMLRAYLRNNTHNSVTVGTYLRSIKTFLGWCIKKRMLTSFALDLEGERTPRLSEENREDTVAGRFMQEEIPLMLKACYDWDIEYGLMNELQRETGARIVDVLTLEFSQWLGDKIRWKNKNTKDPETRVISDRAVEILAQMRELRPNETKVFRWALSSSSRLSRTFNECLKRSGLEKVVDGKKRSAKSWRVVFRTDLVGLPIEVTKKLMRHKSIRTTDEHYTTFSDAEMKGYLKRKNVPT